MTCDKGTNLPRFSFREAGLAAAAWGNAVMNDSANGALRGPFRPASGRGLARGLARAASRCLVLDPMAKKVSSEEHEKL